MPPKHRKPAPSKRFSLRSGFAALRESVTQPGYVGPPSDHFDGMHFRNLDPQESERAGGFWRWRIGRWFNGIGRWSEWTYAEPGQPPPERIDGSQLRLTFVNHATVLIQTAGINILTDPIWSERASPVPWGGPRRRRPPGIRFEDLPRIDLVLVSHNHYDHLDPPTLHDLARIHQSEILVPLGDQALLARHGIARVRELDWWQHADLRSLHITSVPARHFSARGLNDRNRTLWCGYAIQGPAGLLYFAGDTGWGVQFQHLLDRLGRPRVAIMPIGAYLPLWFMGPVHLAPWETVRAHRLLGAELTMAIHFGTFPLADDAEGQAVAEVHKALSETPDLPGEFWVPGFGEAKELPPPG